ncbi:hypothetical protein [Nocardia seriolae]|uniref:Uncharacterized protein n=1 Tax=Nocardia seriolae TaxID=37332 RepID=A0A0B8NCA9_9NOCA|nr:hypothetical protein [Nocardia seriolae]APA95996.1 hypothetical protein NS506_01929 [Nocardia seriolae]MTJ65912.1 hypothetical protein [Nocardia seriolae]MTJ75054.1 hypothetical protein [Nocardia seriolae]MTJ86161.1 hypothetical protein [Nocardia seriolae]MTK30157.1 hypothetical protein [Nocardia seriolae]
MFEGLALGIHLPAGWLWPTLIFFGLIVFAALLVLLLVSGARFDDGASHYVPPTVGSCEPFCGARTPAPGISN